MKKIVGETVNLGRECSLSETIFEKCVFNGFMLAPPSGEPPGSLLENVVLRDCEIRGGMILDDGCLFRNVTFDNVRLNEFATISSDAVFQNVSFRQTNSRFAGLKVSPGFASETTGERKYFDWRTSIEESTDTVMDISRLDAEALLVLGWPTDKIVLNPDIHVKVSVESAELIKGAQKSLRCGGFWTIGLMMLERYRCESGILGLPINKRPDYVADVSVLKEIGAV